MRRHRGMSLQTQLERIYHNLRPEYRYYVRRGDFLTLPELLLRTDEYEQVRKDERRQPPTDTSAGHLKKSSDNPLSAVSDKYDPRECC
ncbi:hypothetical protein X777_11119 [Ooceraea biroi]|uniref:Uncharacterized protein n=1 Tax=Ooceraea biroi TaxID=2015173 RepID=A0A026W3Q2_OOCBI|nr:hypothetical protein X777_11119 [Ooceraea biroi]